MLIPNLLLTPAHSPFLITLDNKAQYFVMFVCVIDNRYVILHIKKGSDRKRKRESVRERERGEGERGERAVADQFDGGREERLDLVPGGGDGVCLLLLCSPEGGLEPLDGGVIQAATERVPSDKQTVASCQLLGTLELCGKQTVAGCQLMGTGTQRQR